MHQDIIDYIGQAQKHGLTDFEIKQNLLSAGWEAAGVEESFVFAKAAESKPQAFGSSDSHIISPQKLPSTAPIIAKPVSYQAVISNPNTNITISEQHFNSDGPSGFKKSTVIILAILLVLSIGGVAFGYYQYIYVTPEKVFSKYIASYLSPKTEPVKSSTSISYSDKTATEPDSGTQEFKVTLNVEGYTDNRDANNTKTDGSAKISFKLGSEEGSMQLPFMNFGKLYFVNLANISQLKGAFGDKDVSWIKFNLDELEKYANEQTPSNASSSSDSLLSNPELRGKLAIIWNDSKILTSGSVLVKETLDTVAVYRLEPQVDSAKFEKAVMDSIDLIQSYRPETETKLDDRQKKAISIIIQKFKIKELKLWIGQKDFRLYKMKIVIAVPSIKDFGESILPDVTPGIKSAQEKSRDAKRLSDIRQLAAVMELYFDDFDGYPASINGIPQGVTPNYIGLMPEAPTPIDGTCTSYYNSYWYTAEGKATVKNGKTVYPSYSLTFCLGEKTGGYSAGIAKFTPTGLESGIACPSTPENCVAQNQNPEADISAELEKMTFNAEISLESTFKEYGVVKEIKEPENALDLLELIKEAFGRMTGIGQDEDVVK